MTQLPDTTTEAGQIEASRILFNLMEWKTIEIVGNLWTTVPGLMFDEKIQWADEVFPNLNLYAVSATGGEPLHMPLAWRVLNWATSTIAQKKEQAMSLNDMDLWCYWREGEVGLREIMGLAQKLGPADAQRAWLDKILSLAIEAGRLNATATAAEPKTKTDWVEWLDSFQRGMEPIRSNKSLPKSTTNAVGRGARLVAYLHTADDRDSWLMLRTNGFRRHNDSASPFVSGFDEWVSRILFGDMRLECCYQIGKKTAPVLLAELRRVYGVAAAPKGGSASPTR